MSVGEAPPTAPGRPRPFRRAALPRSALAGYQFIVSPGFFIFPRDSIGFVLHKSRTLYFPMPRRLLRVPRSHPRPLSLALRQPGSPHVPGKFGGALEQTLGARPRRHGDAPSWTGRRRTSAGNQLQCERPGTWG